jgi:hypothetical protein
MRQITIILVCALIAPLAFAQTRHTKTQQTTTQPATTETVTTYTAGVVTKYQPGKTIVVSSTQGRVSFAMGTSARIVNTAGNAVTSALTPGQRVRVYYTGTGENRVVQRVVVEQ